jgi:hypothetical protein
MPETWAGWSDRELIWIGGMLVAIGTNIFPSANGSRGAGVENSSYKSFIRYALYLTSCE